MSDHKDTDVSNEVSRHRSLQQTLLAAGALTPKVEVGGLSSGLVHREYPLMGMIGRPSVVHFAGVTQWAYTGKQMNGIRLIQIHPRGQITGATLLWEGIWEDTVFVPNAFGPAQEMAAGMGVPFREPANILVDDGYFGNLSGQQVHQCFACRVSKAARE